ncbi:hypothetical protein O181_007957 [Austropuccinia psidii MF-1]|uniref:Lysophospholipase n=1 Tax=Austropuccinia psidii MF-1 TaxID=1389203 RepID=A0A9Q3BNT7_9BASI|nr:hypothetical protein [Austropuccinia psidii MF-1]
MRLFFVTVWLTLTHFSWASSRNRCLWRRDLALINSPSGNYAPIHSSCPEKLFLRAPKQGESHLYSAEYTYVKERAEKSIPLWREYLSRVNLSEFNIEKFLKKAEERGGLQAKTLPNFGFALSGGGARALCLGGSILDAFDSRNEKANKAGIGGILQLANYAAGVSGGSWLLGSWSTSNFPRIPSLNWRLTEQNDLWDWNIAKHYPKVYKVVKQKKKAGFPVSIVDAWGRILSRHFIADGAENSSLQGVGVLWSSIRETKSYKERSAPFVLAVTISRPGEKKDFTPETPTYEFTPEEFGVWHPYLNASIPIEYLGSPSPLFSSEPGACVRGFDNAGFVMGMSSNIFSLGDAPSRTQSKPLFLKLLDAFISGEDFEGKVPNPFQGFGTAGFQDKNREMLLMADCGFTRESIPVFTLIQPARKLDVIIAVDSNADGIDPEDPKTMAYPNGTALFAAYAKTSVSAFSGYRIPKVPNTFDGTFASGGYNKRPTFFGCNSGPQAPLIIYLPNYYATAKTNVLTEETTFEQEEIEAFLDNGFAIASQNAGPTKSTEWPACLACALIDNQVQRNGAQRTAQCEACFKKYCAKRD